MANDTTLTTRFRADIIQFEREIQRLQRLNQTAANRIAQDQAAAAAKAAKAWSNSDIGKAFGRQMDGLSAQVKSMAGVLAGVFAGREALEAADAWKRFGNSLAVVGLQGTALKQVQEQLYQIAIKNGTAIEPLGALYNRLSASQKDIGATAPQMIQFTGGVAAALKVAGVTSEEASGALLQLGQLLGSGTVHAQEFNSVMEGARPILQAVADGNAKAGGSVSELRRIMLDGKLSSADFFQSFLTGSAKLEEQAAKSATTVGQAMTNIHTALTKFIGDADATYGVTDRMTQGLQALADHLGGIAESLAIVGGLYAATFIPAMGRASAAIAVEVAGTVKSVAASVADTAAMIARTAAIYGVSRASATAAVATRALGASMAFFGGPIGLAIIALTVGLGYLAVSSAKAAAETEALSRSIEQQRQTFEDTRKATLAARAEHGQLSTAEQTAALHAAALTGEQNKLKDKLYEVAAAAKAAALATLELQAKQADQNWNQATNAANDRAAGIRSKYENMRYHGVGGESGMPMYSPEQINRMVSSELRGSPEFKLWQQATQNKNDAHSDLETEKTKKLDDYKPTPATIADPEKKKKTHSILSASEDAEAKAQKALNDAINAQAETLEERHAVALKALAEERDDAIRNVQQDIRDKKITAEKGDAAIALYNETYQVKVATENKKYNNELIDQANDLDEKYIAATADALRAQADEASNLADHAKLLKDRQAYERKALELKQQADDLEFEQQQDQLALDRKRAGMTEDVIASLRAQAEANRTYVKNNETKSLTDKQAKDRKDAGGTSVGGQVKELANSFGSLNDQLSNVAKDGINSLTSGLTNAIMGTESLKKAFSDMAKSMIADLIQMAVKFAIFQAIGMALGVPNLGKAAIGLGPTAAHAAGTDFAPGGLSLVGEKGPELAMLPAGTQIAPNNLLRSALSNSAMGGQQARGGDIHLTTVVNAEDAVLTAQIKQWIAQSQIQSVQAAQKLTNRDISKRQKNSFYR